MVGRFLSKDPIVHLGLSQSPNSYSYVWNNPLSLTDPSGYIPQMEEIFVTNTREDYGNPWSERFSWATYEFVTGGTELTVWGPDGTPETMTITPLEEVEIAARRIGPSTTRVASRGGFSFGSWGFGAGGSNGCNSGGPSDPMESPQAREERRATCELACKSVGNMISDVAGSTAAGTIIGLQMSGGNPAVGGLGQWQDLRLVLRRLAFSLRPAAAIGRRSEPVSQQVA